MRVLEKQHEVLVILMEEMAEVAQECSKIMRFGPGEDNIKRLEKEVGDMVCMLEFLRKEKLIHQPNVDNAAAAKYEKLKKWSNLFNELEK